MPRYDYHCPSNDQTFEVKHDMGKSLANWGELREALGLEPDGTSDEAPVKRLLQAASVMGTISQAASRVQGPSETASKMASHSCCHGGGCSHSH